MASRRPASTGARPDFTLKVLMLGNTAVGKTSVLKRYAEGPDASLSNLTATAGVDFVVKTISLQGKTLKLQIWDTAGQERFASLTRNFFGGAHGLVLTYDVTSPESFAGIQKWMTSFQDTVGESAAERVDVIVLGNKVDLVGGPAGGVGAPPPGKTKGGKGKGGGAGEADAPARVPPKDAQALADSLHAPYYETSAYTNTNIDAAFEALARALLQRMLAKPGAGAASPAGKGGKGEGAAAGGGSGSGSKSGAGTVSLASSGGGKVSGSSGGGGGGGGGGCGC